MQGPCFYHASNEVGWYRWLVRQLQGSSIVRQNLDFAKVQLWNLNMDYWSLPDTWQDHLLERIRIRKGHLLTDLRKRHMPVFRQKNTHMHTVYYNSPIQKHTNRLPLTKGGWTLPNTAMRRVWCSVSVALASTNTGISSELWGQITPLGFELPQRSDRLSSCS